MADTRPRATLRRVLDDLGTTLLEPVHGDTSADAYVGGIVIHDPADEADLPPGALVLGVALRDADEIADLLLDLGHRNAAGLVLRTPLPASPAIATAADQSGVAVLGLTRGASWAQLAALVRSLLAEDAVGLTQAESLGGIPSGDLFALANAIAALLDAPVTIEDRSSRVLAYSGRQDETDQSRVETILGRHVPERTTAMLVRRGVFRELYRSAAPVWQEPLEPGQLPRVAIAVRAGDEVLGSIWAAVREPLTQERAQALCDAAKLTALHMLRIRAGTDAQRRLRADLLSTALAGGTRAREALSRLGLSEQPVAVLALTLPEPVNRASAVGTRATLEAERQRLSDAFAMHLAAMHPRSATALIGDIAYGLLPISPGGSDSEDRAVRIAHEFLARTGKHSRAVIGIAPVAHGVTELADAHTSADRVLRVLCSRHGNGPRVARLPEVHTEALVLEVRDLVAAHGDHPTGPIARLVSYDKRHNSQLVETLRAWLDAFGDVSSAASAACVHPNTFRYRLRRVVEISGINLTDPEARFAAMLQLRVVSELANPKPPSQRSTSL